MPTLLTNRRMHPALAARIERSLRGGEHASVWKRRLLVGLRFTVPGVIIACTIWLLGQLDQDRAALAERKARLEAEVAGQLVPAGNAGVLRIGKLQHWLQQESGPYAGDVTRPELNDPRRLSDTLRRGALYLRSDLEAARTGARIQDLAGASSRDAFLLCFLSPPKQRTQKALLSRVRTAYAGDERLGWDTRFAASLSIVYRGLPYLQDDWLTKVKRADDLRTVEALERENERAPLPATQKALESELFLVVLDEPGESNAVTELDGERPHQIRVSLIDLEADRPLLRRRARVAPDWIPEATRVRYARGLDSCGLAFDIRQSLGPPVAAH
ncbi:MAG: hypothetical protein KC766_25945 [Myxococcales bacterium]|nr:hypothetical protein [Myxococcales bacterium]